MSKQKDLSNRNTPTKKVARPYPLLIAGILLTIFIAFLPSLRDGLIFWDDPEYITNNPYTKAFDLKEIFSAYYMGNHPLTLLAMQLNINYSG